MSDLFEAGGLENDAPRPLADRLRPKTLAEVVGQDHLIGAEGPIGRMVAQGRAHSIVLWGPPGTGKTTIARLLSTQFKLHFEQLSAVFSGVADLKKSFEAARQRRRIPAGQRQTAYRDALEQRQQFLQAPRFLRALPQDRNNAMPAGAQGRFRVLLRLSI